jgi:hypothetical protein
MNEKGVRISNNGATAIKQTANGFLAITDPTVSLPSDDLQEIIKARLAVRDPRQALDIVYFEELPPTGISGTAYTIGDGAYYVYDEKKGGWLVCKIFISDGRLSDFIKRDGLVGGELSAIDFIIAGLDPSDYLQSMTAGAESFSFPTYSEALEWFKLQKQMIADANGTNCGRYFKIKSRAVGGINEAEDGF